MADDQVACYLEEWAETADPYSDAIVERACASLRKRAIAFAPSAGLIYAELERISADAAPARRTDYDALPAPVYGDDHRRDMSRRFAALVVELKSGAHVDPHYGERPRGYRPEKPIVNRYAPASWLDFWERVNKRPYPNRGAVEAILSDPCGKHFQDRRSYREAAE